MYVCELVVFSCEVKEKVTTWCLRAKRKNPSMGHWVWMENHGMEYDGIIQGI